MSIERLLGTGWLDTVHPDDRDHCARIYIPAIEARTPFRMEFRIRRADGDYRWVLSLGLPKIWTGRQLFGLHRVHHRYHRAQGI